MTQEEKQLLLKDLCARLPYGVMFDYNKNLPLKVEGIVRNTIYYKGYNYQTEGDECYTYITECKPYLRPMSSMTEEEKNEFNKFIGGENTNWHLFDENRIAHCKSFYSVFCHFSTMGKIIDFFNLHHLDYHGLIGKGLALEAPEGMYKNE